MSDSTNRYRRMIYGDRASLAPARVWLLYSEAHDGGDISLEDTFEMEDEANILRIPPPLYIRADIADADAAALREQVKELTVALQKAFDGLLYCSIADEPLRGLQWAREAGAVLAKIKETGEEEGNTW